MVSIVKKINLEFRNFHKRSIDYLQLWSDKSFEGLSNFYFINDEEIKWQKLEACCIEINKYLLINKIHIDEMFDKYSRIKDFVNTVKEKDFKFKWINIFSQFEDLKIKLPNFTKFIEFVLCLPESSTPVERIFSHMNKIWTDERSTMNFNTIKCLLKIKSNSEHNCSEFFDLVKNDKNFLEKISSNNKYH